MKKLILLTAIFAGLFLSGCANSSSGSDDDTPVPEKITYDILGTWYYAHIYGNTKFGEHKVEFSSDLWGLEIPQGVILPEGDKYKAKIYNRDGQFAGSQCVIYNKNINSFYTYNLSKYDSDNPINSYRLYFVDQKTFKILSDSNNSSSPIFGDRKEIIFTRDSVPSNNMLDNDNSSGSNSDGGSGTGGSSGSGGDEITLSGSYDAAERSGVSLRFNKEEGTWAQWYDGIRRKNGTYSQSGSTLTVNWYSDTQYRNYSADFTVSSENGNIILTASSGDTVTVIGQGFGLSASLSTGKVTLSK